MTDTSHPQAQASDTDLVISRVISAPRERVFAAWTEPRQVEGWWGPEGFTTRVEKLDLKPGGASHYVMIAPDGKEYPCEGVFREVVPPERIVTTDEFGEDFDFPDPSALPQGTILTVTFEPHADGTRLTLHLAHPTAEERAKHEAMGVMDGWDSTLDCLEHYLSQT